MSEEGKLMAASNWSLWELCTLDNSFFSHRVEAEMKQKGQISVNNLWSFQLWKRNYDETVYRAKRICNATIRDEMIVKYESFHPSGADRDRR